MFHFLKAKKILQPFPSFSLRMAMISLDLVLMMTFLSPFTNWLNRKIVDSERNRQIFLQSESQVQAFDQLLASDFPMEMLIYNFLIGIVFTSIILAVWLKFRTSPGKWLFGYRIVDNRDHNQPASKKQLILRALGCMFLSPVFGINFLWCLIDKERRSWHDVLAGTAVIRARTLDLIKRNKKSV